MRVDLSKWTSKKKNSKEFEFYNWLTPCFLGTDRVQSFKAALGSFNSFNNHSIVYIIVHSWWCTFCGFGQIYNDAYPSLYYHRKYFQSYKFFVLHLFIPLLTPNPWLPLIFFTVSITFLFPECHIVGIIQYVAFLDWLLSLRYKHSLMAYFFLVPFNTPLCGCATVYPFIYWRSSWLLLNFVYE